MSAPAPNLSLTRDTFNIALAMALLWTWRPRTDVCNLLRQLDLKRSDGRAYVHDDTKHAYQELREQGFLLDQASRNGYVRLQDTLRIPLYRHLLEHYPGDTLRAVVFEFVGYNRQHYSYYWHVDMVGTVAMLRVALLTQMSAVEYQKIEQAIQHSSENWDAILREAVFEPFDRDSFERIAPEKGAALLARAVLLTTEVWRLNMVAECDLAQDRLDANPPLCLKSCASTWPNFSCCAAIASDSRAS